MRREADRLRLSVVDDGRGPATAERRRPGAGLGIAGMRERARALGGTLAAGPRPDGHPGWQVLLELPLS